MIAGVARGLLGHAHPKRPEEFRPWVRPSCGAVFDSCFQLAELCISPKARQEVVLAWEIVEKKVPLTHVRGFG